MTIEIELKFIATEQAVTDLPGFISQYTGATHNKQTLTNTYYETADGFLRAHNIGLRIRECGQHYEMTLKTAGKVVAGLHQRAEYNIALTEAKLELHKLPGTVWPQGTDVTQLTQMLHPLFTTNFIRETWRIDFQQSVIELAMDIGEIAAGSLTEPLQEIELELLQGKAEDVVDFALQLSQLGGLRLGNQSKAARGYHLTHSSPLREVRPLTVQQVPAKASVEQALIYLVEHSLNHWLYHEELWLNGNSAAKVELHQALFCLRQIWQLWGGVISRQATHHLREQLTVIEEVLLKTGNITKLYVHSGALHIQLAVMKWVLVKGWQSETPEKQNAKMAGSFKRFADIKLSRCAAELKEAFAKPLSPEEMQQQLPRLRRQIINFYLLAGRYSLAESQAYIAAWQTVFQAITANARISIAVKEAKLCAPFWLNSANAV